MNPYLGIGLLVRLLALLAGFRNPIIWRCVMAASIGGTFHLRRTFDNHVAILEGRLTQDLIAKDGKFTVQLVEFLHGEEKSCSGHEILDRMKDCNDIGGYRELEAIIRDQDCICAQARDLVFVAPKTILQLMSVDPATSQTSYSTYFPGIYWAGDEWQIQFYAVAIPNFDAGYRIVGVNYLP